MKRILTFLVILAMMMTASAQGTDFFTKTDFQKEKQQINSQIKATRAPIYELRELINGHQDMIDSLFILNKTADQKISASETKVAGVEEQLGNLQEELETTVVSLNNVTIVFIVVIVTLALICFILIYLLKASVNRKIKHLIADQHKTNEALNLHIQNTSQEIKSLGDRINLSEVEFGKKADTLKEKLAQGLEAAHTDIVEAGKKTDEKIQTNKSSILAITGELETSTTQLASAVNEMKVFIEKSINEFKVSVDKVENTGEKTAGELIQISKQFNTDLLALQKQLAVLSGELKEHHKKGHK